MHQTVCVDWD